MSTQLDRLASEIGEMRRQIERWTVAPWIVGEVTAADTGAQTVDVVDASGQEYTGISTSGVYMPAVGDQVLLLMSGQAPTVLPPGKSAIASYNFVTGTSGWEITAEGDAEFNSVVIRGRAELESAASIIPNGGFESPLLLSGWIAQQAAKTWKFDTTIESWTHSGSSLVHEPNVVYFPPGALKLTMNGTTDSATSPTGLSGEVTTPTTRHRAIALVAAPNACQARVGMLWYNGASLIGSHFGSLINVPAGLATWVTVKDEAVAPATTTRVAVTVEFQGGASGQVKYIDEVAVTLPTNANIVSTTISPYAGSRFLRLSSLAAGVTLAGTPDVTNTGYPVDEGDYYYFSCRYRIASGFSPLVVPAWLDENGVLIEATVNADSFGDNGNSDWQLYSTVWRVPVGATQVGIVVGFIASGSFQFIDVDAVTLRKTARIVGGVWSSEVEEGASATADRMVAYLKAGENDTFPHAFFGGHLFYRAYHARAKTEGSGGQNITTGSWQKVTLNAVGESSGALIDGLNTSTYITVPRTGVYLFGGQVNWNAFFAASTGGIQACAVERWSADGTVLLERYTAQSNYQDVTAGACSTTCLLPGRANKGERLYLTAYQDHGSTLVIQGGAGAVGGQHVLSATYIGDLQ